MKLSDSISAQEAKRFLTSKPVEARAKLIGGWHKTVTRGPRYSNIKTLEQLQYYETPARIAAVGWYPGDNPVQVATEFEAVARAVTFERDKKRGKTFECVHYLAKNGPDGIEVGDYAWRFGGYIGAPVKLGHTIPRPEYPVAEPLAGYEPPSRGRSEPRGEDTVDQEPLPDENRGLDEQSVQEVLADASQAAQEETYAHKRGQGFTSSPERRKAIESRAMDTARLYFEDLKYQVEDTSANRPYDFVAIKGDEKLYVEVKGTSTAGEQVILTKNEVAHARNHSGQMVLFIVHGIEVEEIDGEPVAKGGDEKILWPWDVDSGELTALQFVYEVPTPSG